MRFNKDLRLEKCLSNECHRPALQSILFEDGHLISTNGQIMAIVPAEDCENDTNGLISSEAIDCIRKQKISYFELNGSIKIPLLGADFPRPQNKYPDYKEVFPTQDAKISITLDAKLLLDLANALGSKGKIKLDIIGEEKAIRAYTPEGFGLIMPCKNGKVGGEEMYKEMFVNPEINKKIQAEIAALDRIAQRNKKSA